MLRHAFAFEVKERESEINLELLFGAVTTSPNEFYAYYQSKNQNEDESK